MGEVTKIEELESQLKWWQEHAAGLDKNWGIVGGFKDSVIDQIIEMVRPFYDDPTGLFPLCAANVAEEVRKLISRHDSMLGLLKWLEFDKRELRIISESGVPEAEWMLEIIGQGFPRTTNAEQRK